MIPVVYTSFCTADNALAVAPESPTSRRDSHRTGGERSGQVFLLLTVTQAAFRGSALAVCGGVPLQSPSRIVESSDDDFVDLIDNRFHSSIRAKEEREMIRLDKEWMRVSLAHDALRSTGDVTSTDKSNLHGHAHELAGRNCATRFWDMLRSLRGVFELRGGDWPYVLYAVIYSHDFENAVKK
jgi:hypothetical protein